MRVHAYGEWRLFAPPAVVYCRFARRVPRLVEWDTMDNKPKHGLARGLTNYGDADFSLYLRRSFAKSMGYSGEMLARPVIGIADTSSGFNNCHRNVPEQIEAIKRGVLAAGGLPSRSLRCRWARCSSTRLR